MTISEISLSALIASDGIALHGGREKYGPCPQCGGEDRFHYKEGEGREWCFCNKCHGWGKWIDAVEYLRWRLGDEAAARELSARGGMHPRQAAYFIAARLEKTGETMRADALREWAMHTLPCEGQYKTVKIAIAPATPPQPQTDTPPADEWQQRARAFVTACAAQLWQPAGAGALAYLRGRGLADDTLRAYQIGYNPTRRKSSEWGIGRDVVALAGITIPRFIGGALWAVNVRRMNDDGTPYSGANKYIMLTGSKLGLFNADTLPGASLAVAFGGELDCILAAQFAPADVACVTFGGEGRSIVQPWAGMLESVPDVAVCMDNDAAGDSGAARWIVLDQARRARVPQGKDLTDFHKAGGDVSQWFASLAGRWQPPQSTAGRLALLAQMEARIDDDARNVARWHVLAAGVDAIASDGAKWLTLAQ
jgi:hypothetical protein